MSTKMLFVLLALGLFSAAQIPAIPIDFCGYADDYVSIFIDGSSVLTYNGSGSGASYATVDLARGWHDLYIVYQNRWGTSELAFSQRYAGETD